MIDRETTKPIAVFTHHPPFEVTVGPDLLHFEAADVMSELRSEEHTSELQALMRISYAVFCMTKKTCSISNTHTKHIDRIHNTLKTHDPHYSSVSIYTYDLAYHI